jgi:hypothetical protein
MRPVRKAALAAALTLALVGVAGCGGEERTHEAEEGVPIELGDLEFNVQFTRFLNPTDPEDSEYLAGQKVPPPAGETYLAVFMTIENTSDEDVRLPGPAQVSVVDTTGAAYEALPSGTDFAVPLGSTVPGDGEIPVPGGAAESGPTQGAIILFLVDVGIPENRPLELEIEHEGETGTVTLDI